MPQIRADNLRLLQDFAYLKKEMFFYDLLADPVKGGGPSEMHFFRKVAELPYLRRGVETRLRDRITYEAVKNWDSRMNKAGLRTVNLPYSPATKDPPKETADPDAVFHLIPGAPSVETCLPLTADIDLFLTKDAFYLMSRRVNSAGCLCPQGRFKWRIPASNRTSVSTADSCGSPDAIRIDSWR